jgi:5,10-methylenetetrahydrofolate reductase
LKTLAGALSSKSFAITAEIPVPALAPANEILQQAKSLSPFVDCIQFAQNPWQTGNISPVALAALLLKEGIDPVTRLNCRDRNRLALQSDLVGLQALGVSSLILNRDNRLQNPGALAGKPVFDINCNELISMADAISDEGPGGMEQAFTIGTSCAVFAPRPDWKADRLKKWSKSGARFLQTLPCFNVPLLRRYMQHLVDLRLTWNFAVVVTLAPLPGMEVARWQIENSRGAVVPKSLVDQLASADDPEQTGIEICARQMQEIAAIPGVSGINLMTLGNPAAIVAAIRASGLRAEA